MMTKAWMCRRYDPSARDSYTAPADEDEEHRKDALTLCASHATLASRPICTRHSTRPRPQSYHDILEDFQMHARGESIASSVVASSFGAEERASRLDDRGHHEDDAGEGEEDEPQLRRCERELTPGYWSEEDTARKKKRFSLPVVAVQMVPVVVRSAPVTSTQGGDDCHLCLVQGREGAGEGEGRKCAVFSRSSSFEGWLDFSGKGPDGCIER